MTSMPSSDHAAPSDTQCYAPSLAGTAGMAAVTPYAPTSVDALAALMREQYQTQQALRFVGSGTWLQGGGPFAESTPVSLRALRDVVEYTPGDLVITAGAGMTLAELSAVTAEHGQMLAVAPYGSPDSTIGAVIATSAPAPLALEDLSVRDLVLGLRVVTGTGAITSAGGRVVKNVAGFDLVRLHTGAWGTLGAIAEVSLRLHAIPAQDLLLEGVPGAELGDVLPALTANRAPIPMHLVLAPGEAPRIFARVIGNAARVEGLRRHLAQLGVREIREAPRNANETLRETPSDATVLRLRTAPSDAAPFVRAARQAFPRATLSFAPHRGSLRIVMPGGTPGAAEGREPPVSQAEALGELSHLATTFGASHRISLAIDQGRAQYPARTPLESGIKAAFDPADICNRAAVMEPAPAPLPA